MDLNLGEILKNVNVDANTFMQQSKVLDEELRQKALKEENLRKSHKQNINLEKKLVVGTRTVEPVGNQVAEQANATNETKAQTKKREERERIHNGIRPQTAPEIPNNFVEIYDNVDKYYGKERVQNVDIKDNRRWNNAIDELFSDVKLEDFSVDAVSKDPMAAIQRLERIEDLLNIEKNYTDPIISSEANKKRIRDLRDTLPLAQELLTASFARMGFKYDYKKREISPADCKVNDKKYDEKKKALAAQLKKNNIYLGGLETLVSTKFDTRLDEEIDEIKENIKDSLDKDTNISEENKEIAQSLVGHIAFQGQLLAEAAELLNSIKNNKEAYSQNKDVFDKLIISYLNVRNVLDLRNHRIKLLNMKKEQNANQGRFSKEDVLTLNKYIDIKLASLEQASIKTIAKLNTINSAIKSLLGKKAYKNASAMNYLAELGYQGDLDYIPDVIKQSAKTKGGVIETTKDNVPQTIKALESFNLKLWLYDDNNIVDDNALVGSIDDFKGIAGLSISQIKEAYNNEPEKQKEMIEKMNVVTALFLRGRYSYIRGQLFSKEDADIRNLLTEKELESTGLSKNKTPSLDEQSEAIAILLAKQKVFLKTYYQNKIRS